MSEIILFTIVFFLAGCVQGILGFGFAITTTLILVNHIDFKQLVFLNLFMSALTSLIALFSGHNLRSIKRHVLLKLIGSGFAGLIGGILLIDYTNDIVLKKITLCVILVASILSLTKNKHLFARSAMVWASGFFSGALTPSTGINGPLVALHLNAAFTDKRAIRSTMLAYLFLIMVFGVVSMYLHAALPGNTWSMMGRIVIPSLVGYGAGMLSFKAFTHTAYSMSVTIFLVASSLMSLLYLII